MKNVRCSLAAVVSVLVGVRVTAGGSAGEIPEHRRYGNWESCALGGGGFLQHVAFSPADSNRLYLASDVGGVFRSDDGGGTWHMVHGALPYPDGADVGGLVRDVVAHPSRRDSFLVALGDGRNRACGIYRSDDAGVSYRKVMDAAFYGNDETRVAGDVLVNDPDGSERVYACPPGMGPMVSEDFGLSWRSLGLQGVYARDFVVDRTDSRRMWLIADRRNPGERHAGLPYRSGLFRTEDGGRTWRLMTEKSYPLEMVQDPFSAGLLHGVFPCDPPQVRRSVDGGATWIPPANPELFPRPKSPWADGRYHAISAGPDFVLVASNGGICYRLPASGDTWSRLPDAEVDDSGWYAARVPGDSRFGAALAFVGISPHDSRRWVFTDWFALYVSQDAGRKWKLAVDGIELTVTHCLAQDPSDPSRIHVGMADIGYFRSEDGGCSFGNWGLKIGLPNNVKCIAVCPSCVQRVYAVGPNTWLAQANRLFRSDDAGRGWRRMAQRGLPDMPDAGGRRCNTVAVHPKRPDEIYLTVSGDVGPGKGGIWRSDNGGDDWTYFGQGLPAGCGFRESIWSPGLELAVSPDGDLVAACHGSGRVFRRPVTSSAWSEVKLPGKSFALVGDPSVAGRFYCARMDDGLWRTDDGGLSWRRIRTEKAFSVATDAAVANRLAFSDGNRYFVSSDGGLTCARIEGAPPNRSRRNVLCLSDNRLFVGTCGNGVFRVPCPFGSPEGGK